LSVSGKIDWHASDSATCVKPALFGLLCAWREVLILRQQDLSYFKLRQLEAGEGNVIETTERLYRAHRVVVIYIYIYNFIHSLICLWYIYILNFHKVIISHHHLIVCKIPLVLPMLELASVGFLIKSWKELGWITMVESRFHQQLEESSNSNFLQASRT
jgi:hypothetical protein